MSHHVCVNKEIGSVSAVTAGFTHAENDHQYQINRCVQPTLAILFSFFFFFPMLFHFFSFYPLLELLFFHRRFLECISVTILNWSHSFVNILFSELLFSLNKEKFFNKYLYSKLNNKRKYKNLLQLTAAQLN